MISPIKNKKFIIIGFAAGFSLLVLYFLVLSLANSFSHALEQFEQIWYWLLLLAAGFGLQVALYFYIRNSFRLKQTANPAAALAASGGISAVSMIACCLHHLTDVLPFLGLAAAAAFLAVYQLFFIIVGVLSNLVGIIIMLEIIQKHNLSGKFLKKFLIYDMNKIKKAALGLSLIILAPIFISTSGFFKKEIKEEPLSNLPAGLAREQKPKSELSKTINLTSRSDSRKRISFEVAPIDFNFNEPLKFKIKINTHSGSLDFNLKEISVLTDEKGDKYLPLEWRGSAPGGHHRSGVLIFPKLNYSIKIIKLAIKDIPGAPPRIFEWKLKQNEQ